MVDILIGSDGDIALTANGDISLTDSVRQSVETSLRWILGECRLAPEDGFPWFEEVFEKNPDLQKIKSLIRTAVMAVEGITGCSDPVASIDLPARKAFFQFVAYTDTESFEEEMEINV